MIVQNNLTGEMFEVEDVEPIDIGIQESQPPTTEDRIEALELALLEVILNG